MKIKNFTQSKIKWIVASILIAAMIIVKPVFSQDNSYHFSTVTTTERQTSVGYAGTLNYYWDQGIVDSQGNIHFVFVNNYKLFCYTSDDDGASWTAEQIITGKEGKIRTAMMGLAPGDKRVIAYTVNESMVNGTISSMWDYFKYDAYGIVDEENGWEITPIAMHTTNNGLYPYGIITDDDGTVHIILTRYGWYVYGGELLEATYQHDTQLWDSPSVIKVFTDRSVDQFTNYVGKTAIAANGDILCMYQRHGATTGTYNVEIVVKTSAGWQAPLVLLEATTYSTYNRFDIDNDREGNYCVGYFEPWGDNGPQIYLAKNSTDSFHMFELYQSTDTLVKMSIHSQEDGSSILYCNFKHSYPKILKFRDNLLTESASMPDFPQEDSVLVMKYLYPIPNKSNFSDKLGFYAFTNIYLGKEGNDVLPYDILYATFKITQDFTWIPQNDLSEFDLNICPNPVQNILRIDGLNVSGSKTVSIFDYLGKQVHRQQLNKELDVSHLPAGMYILQIEETQEAFKFIKR